MGKGGFTLLEIMVAISILAIGLVAVLELFASSLRLTGKASQRTQAVIHAQNVVEGLFAQGFLEDGEDSGELPNGFFWRVQVQEIFPDEEEGESERGIEDPSGNNRTTFFHIKEITVRVSWEEGDGHQSFDLHTMRAMHDNPTNSLKEEEQ